MQSMKLERIEEIIIDIMTERFCDRQTAEKIVRTYLPVIRALNDDHDPAAIQAERFYQAYNKGINTEAWLKHIQKTNEKYGKQSNIETVHITKKSTSASKPKQKKPTVEIVTLDPTKRVAIIAAQLPVSASASLRKEFKPKHSNTIVGKVIAKSGIGFKEITIEDLMKQGYKELRVEDLTKMQPLVAKYVHKRGQSKSQNRSSRPRA